MKNITTVSKYLVAYYKKELEEREQRFLKFMCFPNTEARFGERTDLENDITSTYMVDD